MALRLIFSRLWKVPLHCYKMFTLQVQQQFRWSLAFDDDPEDQENDRDIEASVGF